jgi:developmental checkpoint coupling sporulation initiation to replication initiation
MQILNDSTLTDAYYKAYELKLDPDFIVMLKQEIRRRGLSVKSDKPKAYSY